MKIKSLILPVLAIFLLNGCNDTPEIQPASLLINVYPNPVSDIVTINVPNANGQSYAVRMFDTKGKLIIEELSDLPARTYPIPMIDRPNGTYVVIFSIGSTVVTQKLIKL